MRSAFKILCPQFKQWHTTDDSTLRLKCLFSCSQSSTVCRTRYVTFHSELPLENRTIWQPSYLGPVFNLLLWEPIVKGAHVRKMCLSKSTPLTNSSRVLFIIVPREQILLPVIKMITQLFIYITENDIIFSLLPELDIYYCLWYSEWLIYSNKAISVM